MERLDRQKLYSKHLSSGIPRALTELDRDPFSFTYGCFDREYWAWSTKDFSNFDLQRAIYPLTCAYLNSFDGNSWHQESRVRDWIKAAFTYCESVQHSNGSFDHHYPNEFSVVGVAFPLAELGLAFKMLDNAGEFSVIERKQWIEFFTRCSGFLCEVNESHGFISNHRLGAVCGLYITSMLTGEKRFKVRANELLQTVIANTSKEGWTLEYTGADPGYQTLDTNFMAHYYNLSKDDDFLQNLVLPSLNFLIYFFHPDGSVGGEYGSRNCPLYYPGGVELFANYFGVAETIAQLGAKAIERDNSPALGTHDIRNFIPMMSSYSLALTVCLEGASSVQPILPPFEREFERYWPDAGFFVRSDQHKYTIIGCSKGGIAKVFDKKTCKIEASHSGYFLKNQSGQSWSTQFHENYPVINLRDCSETEVKPLPQRNFKVKVHFYKVVSRRLFTPISFFLFRFFCLTVGKNLKLNNWVKRHIIIGLLIHRRKRSKFSVVREFVFNAEGLTMYDELSANVQNGNMCLRAADIFTTIYMGSSKYYRHSEKLQDGFSDKNLVMYIDDNNVLKSHIGNKGLSLINSKIIERPEMS